MTYIILDMEWNQALTKESVVTKPVFLFGEIVQIGAVKLNSKFRETDKFKISIRPKYYTKMHSIIEELTKITTEDLRNGTPFPEAIESFQKWCGDDFKFLIWGRDDVSILRSNILLHGLSDDWLPRFYNLQLIFNRQNGEGDKVISLKKAVELIGEKTLKAHDAMNDAVSTYYVLRHLNMKKGIEEYDKQIENQQSEKGKTYPNAIVGMNECKNKSFICPECGKKLKCKKWYSQTSRRKFSGIKCSCGKELFVRINLKKRSDGNFTAKLRACDMTDEYREILIRKKSQKQDTPKS